MRQNQSKPESDPRPAALRLLAHREHSRLELQRKLDSRGFDRSLVATVLDRLEQEGLLSDQRFAESFIHVRRERGFGPVRIRAELKERGISNSLIETFLESGDEHWREVARHAYVKRYGETFASDSKERARRLRFLTGRGFAVDLAYSLIGGHE